MMPLYLTSYTATSCIGTGLAATLDSLRQGRSGLRPCAFDDVDLDTYVGIVDDVDSERIARTLSDYDCRNNRLAQLALRQDRFRDAVDAAIGQYGRQRVGIFLGTSTSGIHETEIAYRHRHPITGALPERLNYAGSHNTFSVASFLRALLGTGGPAVVISTACSSGAKVFGSAQRLIAAGVIDAAVVGGCDSLCRTTLYGFHSLQLVSAKPCRPFDANRDGLSLGEAAAFALLERDPRATGRPPVALRGVGESNDAYHLSAPHPNGLGARLSMQGALRAGGLAPEAVDYVNLHGTATRSNDAAESEAVLAVFAKVPPCSSTKGLTGHALGAAGALEAVISALALEQGFLPGGVNVAALDPDCRIPYLLQNRTGPVRVVLSNSFGFGGTNCSLLLARAD